MTQRLQGTFELALTNFMFLLFHNLLAELLIYDEKSEEISF